MQPSLTPTPETPTPRKLCGCKQGEWCIDCAWEKAPTPRTAALLAALREKASPEVWCADDTSNFLKLARTLEREGIQLKKELEEAKRQAALYNADTMKVMDQRDHHKLRAEEWQKMAGELAADIASRRGGIFSRALSRFNTLNQKEP